MPIVMQSNTAFNSCEWFIYIICMWVWTWQLINGKSYTGGEILIRRNKNAKFIYIAILIGITNIHID